MSDCCVPQAVLVPAEQPIAAIVKIERGPAGPIGGAVTATAGEAIAAYTPVYITNDTAFIASNDDLVNVESFAGIAEVSGNLGDSITVVSDGHIQNPSWNWTNGFVWLSASGTLTQTLPAPSNLLYRQFIGIAVSPVKIILRISEPVLYNLN